MQPIKLKDVFENFGMAFSGDEEIDHIVTDSREVGSKGLFVAIIGENIDGHNYIEDAFNNGAAAVMVSKDGEYKYPDRVIKVENTSLAHIGLGKLYRDRFDIPIVAVTGSVGKTTTKEFIAAVLSGCYETHKNQGNFNNELGLPKTLFKLDSSHEVAVLEMGMSSLGEIHNLTTAVRPAIGVITNIGLSHIELLGSQDNIFKAKLELLDGMEKGSPLILWGDDHYLLKYENSNYEIIRYGLTNPENDIKGDSIAVGNGGTTFNITSKYGKFKAFIPTIGEHNVLNALAAFAVGVKMGIEPEKAVEYLSRYKPAGMRQRMVEHKGITYVEDCYNSSPASLKAAAVTLSGYEAKGRKIMVLSDMLELGDIASNLHKECGAFIASRGIDLLMTTGPLSVFYVDGAFNSGMERATHFESKAALAEAIKSVARPGDIIWIKASRGMQLEEVLELLYKEC